MFGASTAQRFAHVRKVSCIGSNYIVINTYLFYLIVHNVYIICMHIALGW